MLTQAVFTAAAMFRKLKDLRIEQIEKNVLINKCISVINM